VTVAVILVIAVFFLGMGVYALAAPTALIRPFGVTLNSPVARSEVRAVYGGFGLAIAAVLGYAAFRDGDVQKGIVLAVGVALVGVALGRIVSATVDARTPFYPNWFYFLIEVIGGGALLAVA
jgi:tellurite resistance protein TehA-like permease